MKKLTALFVLCFLLMGCNGNLSPYEQKLPFHPRVLRGKLDNGLSYFILENNEPKERVYLRLIVNAGSMNEDEDQKGVAHIVEHMAFNGSAKYPENQIINALERLGMKFARDINAFTDFENTVYTLNLSGNEESKLALAFEVIDEWMNNLTILEKDLDAERGVVLEEWRSRLSPMLRLGDKKSAIEMAGSRYIRRDPIGEVNIIKNISAKRVKDFYQKWYRPDNMSLVVVGDIDKGKIQSLIKQKLAHSFTPNTPLEQVDYSIPLLNQWRFARVSEPETDYRSIDFSLFEPYREIQTLEDYKQELIDSLLGGLLNNRLKDWEKQHSQLLDSAAFYDSLLGRETRQHLFTLQLAEQDYQGAVALLFRFLAEINQHGFSPQEFEREVARLQALNKRKLDLKRGSLRMADELMTASVMQRPLFLSQSQQYRLKSRLLKEIRLQEVEQRFRQMVALKSKLMLLTQPKATKLSLSSSAQIARLWHESFHQPQRAWEDIAPKDALPALDLTRGTIVDEVHHDKGDIYQFTLSNGSRLIYHYSDKSPQQVYFKALTQGGVRSVPPQDFHQLRSAAKVIDESGIGGLSPQALERLFSKNPLGLSTVLEDYYQGFIGSGKTENFEQVLRLFRLRLEDMTVDPEVLSKYKKDSLEYLKQRDKETEFARRLSKLRHPNVETVYSQRAENLSNLSATQIRRMYQHYIADKTDFTYFIVGDIRLNQVKTLAQQYLAGLPRKEQRRSAYPVVVAVPEKRLSVAGFSEPRAEAELYLVADKRWQAEDSYLLDILADILQEKLRLLLRERESGIYAVNASVFQEPQSPQMEGRITFSAAPDRVDYLLRLTHLVLDEIIQKGVEPELLQKKINEKKIQIKQNFDSLVFVLNQIEQSYLLSQSSDLIYLYQRLEQDVSAEKIHALAKKLFDRKGRFEAVLSQ
ncbi:zinc protease [Mesocricetibacter intestinalis]|uniref:Zinc protease n=1 Tax=Mesocricetibacter intestinalis TaxID=1521930 RepID=A0A4R6VB34_9PAST|nr:M16 family metallopeptidase [Mesocricetibacter intestinalis]TDQ59438.1 zinc protease [Mesocricetibacter intestinalis]